MLTIWKITAKAGKRLRGIAWYTEEDIVDTDGCWLRIYISLTTNIDAACHCSTGANLPDANTQEEKEESGTPIL